MFPAKPSIMIKYRCPIVSAEVVVKVKVPEPDPWLTQLDIGEKVLQLEVLNILPCMPELLNEQLVEVI